MVVGPTVPAQSRKLVLSGFFCWALGQVPRLWGLRFIMGDGNLLAIWQGSSLEP